MHFFFVFITMNEFNINKFLIERKMLNIHPKFGLDGYNEVRNRKKKERKKEKTIKYLSDVGRKEEKDMKKNMVKG